MSPTVQTGKRESDFPLSMTMTDIVDDIDPWRGEKKEEQRERENERYRL